MQATTFRDKKFKKKDSVKTLACYNLVYILQNNIQYKVQLFTIFNNLVSKQYLIR